LIAPFAFLGSEYDDELKVSYTQVDTHEIFIVRSILSILFSESVASTEPLKNLIAKSVDEDMLDKIAVEYKKGRRLYVASTNLDAEQPVIWDMGAIASAKNSNRLALFREILLASAAIPSIFPPVLIDVTKDGSKHQELHADGGVFFQSFSVGGTVDLPKLISAAHPDFTGKVEQNLYVIRNGWVNPTFQQVERSLPSIAGRAILTMFKVSGINDLWRQYLSARDDKVSFHYIAIPADYVPANSEQFNEAVMNQEFDLGRNMALQGTPWKTSPPGYAAPENQTPTQ